MKCPFCNHAESQVKDSRTYEDGAAIRRRRQCPECAGRFTTFERVQLRDLTVIKINGEKEPFDRDKIHRSLSLALRKRPIETERIEKITSGIVRRLESQGESEIKTKAIGELIMDTLAELDAVAYIRFASVYKDFSAINDFKNFIQEEKL